MLKSRKVSYALFIIVIEKSEVHPKTYQARPINQKLYEDARKRLDENNKKKEEHEKNKNKPKDKIYKNEESEKYVISKFEKELKQVI